MKIQLNRNVTLRGEGFRGKAGAEYVSGKTVSERHAKLLIASGKADEVIPPKPKPKAAKTTKKEG